LKILSKIINFKKKKYFYFFFNRKKIRFFYSKLNCFFYSGSIIIIIDNSSLFIKYNKFPSYDFIVTTIRNILCKFKIIIIKVRMIDIRFKCSLKCFNNMVNNLKDFSFSIKIGFSFFLKKIVFHDIFFFYRVFNSVKNS
jgi:hypothetical protein